MTPPALGAQPRSCTRVVTLGAQPCSCTCIVVLGAQLLPCTRVVLLGPSPISAHAALPLGPTPSLHTSRCSDRRSCSAVSGCWCRQMLRGVQDVHTPSPTESLTSPAPRHGPLQPVGRPHRGLRFSPDLASAFTNRPLGRQQGLHPSIRSGSLPPSVWSAFRSVQTWGLAGAPTVQSCPDPSRSRSGAEATRGDVRLWDLGSGCPAGLLFNLGCQELGIMTSWNSGLVLAPAGTQMGPIPNCSWSLSDTHTHTHTHSTDARTHSSCLPSTAPEQSATLDPTHQDSGPDGAPAPYSGPHPVHMASPTSPRNLPAVPSGSHLSASGTD